MLLPLGLLLALAGCRPEAPAPEVVDTTVPAAWHLPLDAPAASGANGAVASDDSIATAVGLRILREGGNAVDAAVATAFALAVTYPEAGNLGGGGFIVLRMADGTTASLDFREKAPLAATRDMFLDESGDVDEDQSLWSHRSSGVPGSVMGLFTAHERFGRLAWRDVVAPAIALARDGFVVNERFEEVNEGRAERLARHPGAAAILLPGGAAARAGTVWRNPDLAATLTRIAEQGPAGFYAGRTADLIVEEMRRGGGLITREDLAAYAAAWREPVVFDYRGHTVVSMPPASSGGITLGIAANILEGYDVAALGWRSPEVIHLTAEALRRAFADRNHYLGDPDFVGIPRAWLLSEEHAAAHRASIRMDRATPSMEVTPAREGGPSNEGRETTHLSVADDEGNAVALTTTVNFLFGSGIAVTGAGFFLNNEMDDFASKPGSPNAFGLVQGEANAIEPGKRMLSAMTPTIVLDASGAPMMVVGGRGGPYIISETLQVISNVIDFGLDLATAVNAPRIHHQHLPDELVLEEDGYSESLIAALRSRGHEIEFGGSGKAESLLKRGDVWSALADGRVSGGWGGAF
ncbi:MAG TPA: gamma-glutamyltransferase [Longimicrobiales bacterium]|nr:gamma-glutamyltransferase [Longimicrobiales bacterium]